MFSEDVSHTHTHTHTHTQNRHRGGCDVQFLCIYFESAINVSKISWSRNEKRISFDTLYNKSNLFLKYFYFLSFCLCYYNFLIFSPQFFFKHLIAKIMHCRSVIYVYELNPWCKVFQLVTKLPAFHASRDLIVLFVRAYPYN